MQQKRLPILQKVSNNILKTSIFIASKMRKPIIAKLILHNKYSRKLKRFKLIKRYNYRFLDEYQFSASSTPLIRYRGRKLNKNRCFQDICSMFFLCTCFGGFKVQGAEAAAVHNNSPPCSLALETLPAAVTGEVCEEPLDLVEDEDDSVDQRAEKFIEWFYQEMRLQRQDSI
ncbi:hypothetical protein AB3S75_005906 [Citrus x aurantiifolia]